MLTPADTTKIKRATGTSGFQKRVAALCILLAFVDGLDLVAITFAAPALRADLDLSPQALGTLLSAALFGAMAGNFVCGPIGDRIGRKPVIVTTTLLFATGTILTGLTHDFWIMGAVRIATGFGLGVANITAYALCSEYFPKRLSASVIAICTAGYTVGAALGGLVASAIIPTFGWRSIFLLGGSLGLTMGVVLAFALPESIRFLVNRGRRAEALVILDRIDPAVAEQLGVETAAEDSEAGKHPIRALFSDGRALRTVLLWTICFMSFMELFFIQQWLPTLANQTGSSVAVAARLGSVLQLGGLMGALWFAWLLRDRSNPFALFCVGFIVAAVAFVVLSRSMGTPVALAGATLLAGIFIPGLQTALNGAVAAHYPSTMRSTGLSWAVGIGRAGSVVGPILAGALLGRMWAPEHVLAAAAAPACCAAIAAILLFVSLQRDKQDHQTEGYTA